MIYWILSSPFGWFANLFSALVWLTGNPVEYCGITRQNMGKIGPVVHCGLQCRRNSHTTRFLRVMVVLNWRGVTVMDVSKIFQQPTNKEDNEGKRGS